MNTTTINPDRLAQLEAGMITLDRSNHDTFEEGHCAMEVVAWLADLGHTDAPSCASRVIRAFTIRLNDRWPNEKRQKLAPYLPRMIGTANDGHDTARGYLAADWVVRTVVPAWLDLAGLTDHAQALRDLDALEDGARTRRARKTLQAARAAARLKWKTADAAADAAAAAAADADAAAAAAADAYAAAAAAAYAAAYADADAYAAAYAAADAAAAAYADADAYAAAYADADADADAYADIRRVRDEMRVSALDLLDRMIEIGRA